MFLRDFCVYSMKVNVFDDATSEDCTKQKAAPLGPLAALNTAIDSIDLLNTLAPCIQREAICFLVEDGELGENHIHMMLNQPNDNGCKLLSRWSDLGMIS